MNRIIANYKNDGTYCNLGECDYVQLELLGPHAKDINAMALVSKTSLETILQFKWYLSKDKYPNDAQDKQYSFLDSFFMS